MAKGIDDSIFPNDVTTAADKLEFAYRAEQLLINLHNEFVRWRDEGLLEVPEWAAFPSVIKQAFPYEPQITAATWQRFHDEEWLPRIETVHEEILKHRPAVMGTLSDPEDEEASENWTNSKQAYKNSNRWPTLNPGDINKFLRT